MVGYLEITGGEAGFVTPVFQKKVLPLEADAHKFYFQAEEDFEISDFREVADTGEVKFGVDMSLAYPIECGTGHRVIDAFRWPNGELSAGTDLRVAMVILERYRDLVALPHLFAKTVEFALETLEAETNQIPLYKKGDREALLQSDIAVAQLQTVKKRNLATFAFDSARQRSQEVSSMRAEVDALALVNRYRKLLGAQANQAGLLNALQRVGQSRLQRGLAEEAFEPLREAYALASAARPDQALPGKEEVMTLVLLCTAALASRQKFTARVPLDVATKAFEKLLSSQVSTEAHKAVEPALYLAQIFGIYGNLERATNMLRMVLGAAEREPNHIEAATWRCEAYAQLGHVHRASGNHIDALRAAEFSLDIAENYSVRRAASEQLPDILSLASWGQLKAGELDLAEAYLKRAVEVLRSSTSGTLLSRARQLSAELKSLADFYLRIRRFVASEAACNESLAIRRQIHEGSLDAADSRLLAESLQQMQEICISTSRHAEANSLLMEIFLVTSQARHSMSESDVETSRYLSTYVSVGDQFGWSPNF